MKPIISLFFVCMLLITALIPISATVNAGTENDPEIRDHIFDVRLFGFLPFLFQVYFKHIDMISIWFSEDSDEPDYLYVSLKLRDLKENTDSLESVYVVHWVHEDKMWEAALKIHPTGIYGTPHIHRYYGHDDYSDFWTVDCTLDFEDNIITWKIPKDKIGNPKPGDQIIDTWGFTNLRHTEESGKLRVDLFKDFTSYNAKWEKDYTILY